MTMKKPDVICLYAPKASGKGTAADVLIGEYGYTPFAFADAVRDATAAAYGLDRDWFRRVSTDHATKEQPYTVLGGRTPRESLIALGMHFRDLDKNHWLDVGKRAIKEHLDAGRKVVITDARFENEAVGVRDTFGAVVVGIRREATWLPEADNGPAEAAVYAGWHEGDRIITNDGSIDELREKVRTAMERSAFYRWRKGERCFVAGLGPGRIVVPERDHMIDVVLVPRHDRNVLPCRGTSTMKFFAIFVATTYVVLMFVAGALAVALMEPARSAGEEPARRLSAALRRKRTDAEQHGGLTLCDEAGGLTEIDES